MNILNGRKIYAAYVEEASQHLLNGPEAEPELPASEPEIPPTPSKPIENANVTGQQIVDFFENKKNIQSNQSKTLTYLANNPTKIVSEPRNAINQILNETQYSQEIPKNEISKIFLSVIRDYEHNLGGSPTIKTADKAELDNSSEQSNARDKEKLEDIVNTIVRVLKAMPKTVVNTNAVADATQAVQNIVNTRKPYTRKQTKNTTSSQSPEGSSYSSSTVTKK